ncbi:MAG: hypothetical protein K5773_01140 [Pseudobutyrivibrio sp.]|nr:hypothetical protein [Pseudobutyrivibrio sp.]
MEKLLYEKLSNDRNPDFNIITDIVERDGEKIVIKRPADQGAKGHIKRVFDAYEGLKATLEGSEFLVNESTLVGDAIESQFLTGDHLTAEYGAKYVEAIKNAYLKNATAFSSSPEFEQVFGQVSFPMGTLASKYIDIDLIFDNIIKTSRGWEIIDYEWTFDFLIPINYVLYRAVKFSDLPSNLVEIPDAEREMYEKMEEHFQSKYCFKGVKNLHELQEHAKSRSKNSADFIIASRDYQIKQLQELIAAKDVHIRNIEAVNQQLREIYDNTVNTKGYKALESFRGFKGFFTGKSTPASQAKKAAKIAAKEQKRRLKEQKKQAAKGEAEPSIAVHLHCYYVDLLPEFVSYFANIPFKFDLYISCQENADVNAIRDGLKELKSAKVIDVRQLPNRGRDLAPLYSRFREEIMTHDYFLHVHTKKSFYSGEEKAGWRQFSLELLLGSSDKINYIFDLFKNQNAGLVYPDIHDQVPTIAYSWLQNKARAKELFEEFKLGQMPEVFNYPAGSFFWARTDALGPIFERAYTYDDFEREQGQTDGTLAHALERILPFVSRKQGYDDYILYLEEGDTVKNKSLRPFANVLKMDKELLTMKLGAYDIVSFDIFDTLITRSVFDPDDVFRIIENIIKEKYGKKVDFLCLRKKAEAAATEKFGPATTIDKIYMEVAKDKTIGNFAMDIKRLEKDIEYNICIPRKEMVEVFNNLKNMGVKIILVSDMYLSRADVVGMLRKCGIGGFEEVFISCEVGARKDDGSMWDILLQGVDLDRFIHLGDNFASDLQILMDRHIQCHPVMSPRALLDLSDFAYLREYAKKSLGNSIALGLAINGGIFNSPFAYDDRGNLKFKSIYDFGFTTMGPVMARFTQWLVDTEAEKNERLLLLAREGYVMEQLFKAYCSARGEDLPDIKYFLASRRACAVPALENDEDLKELLSQKYQGSFSNLLKERLGLEIHEDDPDFDINYQTEIDTIMDRLKPYSEELAANAKAEKQAFINYSKEFIDDAKDIAVVDVGFSGTIQYFLMKLTGRDIAGHYLCLHSNKPERIGGKADAIFTIKDKAKIGDSKLLKYQLFLESALSAPFGQLIKFEMKDGKPVAKYKEDDYVSQDVQAMQQGIIDYCSQFAASYKRMARGSFADPGLVEDIFYDIISAGTLTEDLVRELSVEDAYSKGGVQKFDVQSGTWKVD